MNCALSFITIAPGAACIMQATLPPVWSEIERYRRRRGRVTLAELTEITARAHRLHLQMLHLPPQELRRLRELRARLDWPRHRPELLLYTPAQLRQLIRLGSVAAAESVPHPPRPSPASSWRPGPLGAPWHLPDNNPSSEPRSASGEWAWRGARGWGAGALLLVAALLLVRATDRCFTRSYARSRRRRSEEWPTPNVLATSQQNASNIEMDIPPEDTYQSESSSPPDLPPPYSACKLEDPPPPYSACQVTFSHPKQEPSVRFYTQHDCDGDAQIAHSSNGFNLDTGQNPIGERIHKIPYFDRETDDSDDCNGDATDSMECVSVATAPIASGELSIDNQDGESRHEEAC